MLSPQECSLLQTYPPNFRIPNSKTAAYKQFGNSVTVEMVRHVCRELVDYLYT
jgi:DNA (cytosine-5)-methyltransferase 1